MVQLKYLDLQGDCLYLLNREKFVIEYMNQKLNSAQFASFFVIKDHHLLRHSFLTSLSRSTLVPDRTSLQPALASSKAIALPIPADDPVIQTTLPLNVAVFSRRDESWDNEFG